jgi:hypothetical protein
VIFKYAQVGGFKAIAFEFGDWSDPNAKAAPGEGFFVQNNGATAQTLTFVGEVPQGTLKTTLATGLNLVSSQVPQAGKLVADLKFPATEGDVVYQWDSAVQKYKAANGFEFGDWANGDPTIAVGEGFFVSKATAGSWDRTFSVN